MKIIPVPRVTRRAFDVRRNASDLIRRQVVQLEHVVERLKGAGVLKRRARSIRTEAQAAAFVTDAMRALKRAPPPPAAAVKRKATIAKTKKKAATTAKKKVVASRTKSPARKVTKKAAPRKAQRKGRAS
jgi:hypothetical protein